VLVAAGSRELLSASRLRVRLLFYCSRGNSDMSGLFQHRQLWLLHGFEKMFIAGHAPDLASRIILFEFLFFFLSSGNLYVVLPVRMTVFHQVAIFLFLCVQ